MNDWCNFIFVYRSTGLPLKAVPISDTVLNKSEFLFICLNNTYTLFWKKLQIKVLDLCFFLSKADDYTNILFHHSFLRISKKLYSFFLWTAGFIWPSGQGTKFNLTKQISLYIQIQSTVWSTFWSKQAERQTDNQIYLSRHS